METESVLSSILENYSLEQQIEMLAEEEGYRAPPVDIQQFVDDPEYLGDFFGGLHEYGDYAGLPKLHPIWRDLLYEVYPNPFTSPFEEVILSGSIGSGKSTAALIGCAYDEYRLTLLKSPQQKYGLAPTTIVAIALFTATKTLGSVVLYSQLQEMFMKSPYFRRIYSPRPNHPEVLFPGNIGIINGSQYKDALGTAIFGGILDEANFMEVRLNQALDNYNNIVRRMTSRFAGIGGSLPGKLWMVSSKNDSQSFLEEHINKNRDNPKVKVVEHSLWEALEYRGIYSGKRFKVYIGDENKDPRILTDKESDAITEGQPTEVDLSRVIDVPVEFHEKFESDLLGSLRDIAGKSTTSKVKLFRSIEQLNKCLYATPRAFTQDIIQLDMKEDGNQIIDYIDTGFHDFVMKGKDAPHFIHMDLSLKHDLTGIAMARAQGSKEIVKVDPKTGTQVVMQELFIVIDFAVAIKALNGEEVPLFKILQFILDLRARGINLGGVDPNNFTRTNVENSYDRRTGSSLLSADSYQSADILQRLRKQGFEATNLSVDRDRLPYLSLKKAVTEQRILMPKNNLLVKELLELEETGKKFDHPIRGCFTGDTRISLTNGTEVPIRDLVGKEFEVYSYDLETKRIKPGRAINCRVTRKDSEIIKIVLDNGEEIRCTPDHRFLLRDGTYKEAKDLSKGESLMPLYRGEGKGGYERFIENETGKWNMTHIKFATYLYPQYKPTPYGSGGHVIHHKDFNKRNNSSENLIFCESQSEHFTKYHKDHIKRLGESQKGEKHPRYRKDLTPEKVARAYKRIGNTVGVAKHFKVSKYVIQERLKKAGVRNDQMRRVDVTAEEVYNSYLKHKNFRKVAKNLKISNKLIFDRLKNYEPYQSTKKGSMSPKIIYEKYKEIGHIQGTARFFKCGIDFINSKLKEGGYSKIIRPSDKMKDSGLKKIYKKTLSEKETAKYFNVSGVCVRRRLKKMGIITEQKRKNKLTSDQVYKMYLKLGTVAEVAEYYRVCPDFVFRRLNGYPKYHNHKVVSVRKMIKTEDVFDFEVERYNNFALTAGVFVHNSKDLSDAVCGAYFSAFENSHSSQLYSDRMIMDMRDELYSGGVLWDKKYGKFVGKS